MKRSTLLAALLAFALSFVQGLVFDSFPSNSTAQPAGWSSSVAISSARYVSAPFSGYWGDTVSKTFASTNNYPRDFTNYTHVEFWIYSTNATGSTIVFQVQSENPSAPGADYYWLTFVIDWENSWKKFSYGIASNDFTIGRSPLGWGNITGVVWASKFGSWNPDVGTHLYFDDIAVVYKPLTIALTTCTLAYLPIYSQSKVQLPVKINANTAVSYYARFEKPDGSALPSYLQWAITNANATVAANSINSLNITFTFIGNGFVPTTPLPTITAVLRVYETSSNQVQASLIYTVQLVDYNTPYNNNTHPYIYGNADDRNRILTSTEPVLISSLNTRLNNAKNLFNSPYLGVPQIAAGWTHNFVCTDGNDLLWDVTSPDQYFCPSQNTYYNSSNPAMLQAWYNYKHQWVITGMVDMSLAYFLNKTQYIAYGQKVHDLLIGYADIYPGLELGDYLRNYPTNSANAGKVTEQSLDEAAYTVSFVLCYDFVYDLFTPQEKAHVEWNLFKYLARTISRNNATLSNFQVWHNAALAGIALITNDLPLLDTVINNPGSGMIFLLQNGIIDDGIWWESSMAYHYYALQAFMQMAECTRRASINLWNVRVPMSNPANGNRTKGMESLLQGPVSLALPDNIIPSLNDATAPSIGASTYAYELGKSSYPTNPLMDWVLATFGRGTLVADILGGYLQPLINSTSAPAAVTKSYDSFGFGFAVLRHPANNSKLDYIGFDYGMHGGIHGHNDKLNVILHSQGSYMARDVPTDAYSLDVHLNYYKVTASHNTIVINQVRQLASDGRKEYFCDDLVVGNSETIFGNSIAARRVILRLPSMGSSYYDVTFIFDKNATAVQSYHNVSFLLHATGVLNVEDSLNDITNTNTLTDATAQQMLGVQADTMWKYYTGVSQYVPTNTSVVKKQFDVYWSGDVVYQSTFQKASDFSTWINLIRATYNGVPVAQWSNMVKLSLIKWNCPSDWTQMDSISFTITSMVANGATYTLQLVSENANTTGSDYYWKQFTVDYIGTRTYYYRRKDLSTGRTPIGYGKIDNVIITSSFGAFTPKNDSLLYFSNFGVLRADNTSVPSITSRLRVSSSSYASDAETSFTDVMTASTPYPEPLLSVLSTVQRRQMPALLPTSNSFAPFVHVWNAFGDPTGTSSVVKTLASNSDCVATNSSVVFTAATLASVPSRSIGTCTATQRFRLTSQIVTPASVSMIVQTFFNEAAPYTFEGSVISKAYANDWLFYAYGLVNNTICYDLSRTETTRSCFAAEGAMQLSLIMSNVAYAKQTLTASATVNITSYITMKDNWSTMIKQVVIPDSDLKITNSGATKSGAAVVQVFINGNLVTSTSSASTIGSLTQYTIRQSTISLAKDGDYVISIIVRQDWNISTTVSPTTTLPVTTTKSPTTTAPTGTATPVPTTSKAPTTTAPTGPTTTLAPTSTPSTSVPTTSSPTSVPSTSTPTGAPATPVPTITSTPSTSTPTGSAAPTITPAPTTSTVTPSTTASTTSSPTSVPSTSTPTEAPTTPVTTNPSGPTTATPKAETTSVPVTAGPNPTVNAASAMSLLLYVFVLFLVLL
jgi:hypothetical protein